MIVDNKLAVYPISVASNILGVHPRTLRIYESEGLIKPKRQGGRRLFSQNDIVWVQCVRDLIHKQNLSIQGLKKLLGFLPCWRIKNCPQNIRSRCPVLKETDKRCWELTKNVCERSCKNCDVYLKGKTSDSD